MSEGESEVVHVDDTGSRDPVGSRDFLTAHPMLPEDIERASFAQIAAEMAPSELTEPELSCVMRAIHATADFSFQESLVFTHDAANRAVEALRRGATIVTDTNMALAGISKAALSQLGCQAVCFMSDDDVAREARERKTTRAVVSMERACELEGPVIFAIGNAPTALLRLVELVEEGRVDPACVIGVPVGFVNVVESKERALGMSVPAIVARGRKGGSTVATALVNALLYHLVRPSRGGVAPGGEKRHSPDDSEGMNADDVLRRYGVAGPVRVAMLDALNGPIAIYAGTTEGRVLCERLSAAGRRAFCHVATEYGGELVSGLAGIEVREGRLDAEQMARDLTETGVRLVIDATHPYATEATRNLRDACGITGCAYVRLGRPVSVRASEALVVGDVEEAVDELACRLVADDQVRVLVTTGTKDLAAYTRLPDFASRLYVRTLPSEDAIRAACDLGFARSHLICMQGPFSRELNVAILHATGAGILVTKDSGELGGTAEKIEAAREVGAVPIVIARPGEERDAMSLDEACALLGV